MELTIHQQRYRRVRLALATSLVGIVAIAAADRYSLSSGPTTLAAAPGRSDDRSAVAAPGRIEPKDGVIAVAAPSSLAGPAVVLKLHVREGDWVREGQILATLRGRAELQAALTGRQRERAIAVARLAALTSGAKDADVRALRAEVERDDAALAQADAQARRAAALHERGLLDTATFESHQSQRAMAGRSADASRARLSGLSSARPADVDVANAEVAAADAAVEEALAALESSIVRAPADGRVLVIHAQGGQAAGPSGVLALGKTTEMFVDAEVMEEDSARVRVGQRARITGHVLRGTVDGIVEQVGAMVGSREVFKTDAAAFADTRIIHVKIRAFEPSRLERFINARVTVTIEP
jgi:HlyD family secretion protein